MEHDDLKAFRFLIYGSVPSWLGSCLIYNLDPNLEYRLLLFTVDESRYKMKVHPVLPIRRLYFFKLLFRMLNCYHIFLNVFLIIIFFKVVAIKKQFLLTQSGGKIFILK